MKSFLKLPKRCVKPRNQGLTMVMDTGIPNNQISDSFHFAADFVDFVKLGWGTAMVSKNLKEKIHTYQKNEVNVYLGGTLLELAYVQQKIDAYRGFLIDCGINHVEVSDGTVIIPRKDKLKIIEEFAKEFIVLSEYGSKDGETVAPPHLWNTHMSEELSAGAWKLIAEGRESGSAGMYRSNSELRTGLIEEIVHEISHEKIIWETPKKDQQCWFIQRFGSDVNVGNIALTDVISLETLRLGLRSDTLMHFHDQKEVP